MAAPRFYRELIENVATIDATTRRHVAFVVFHGDRSNVYEDGSYYGVGPRDARIRLIGLSISGDPGTRSHHSRSNGGGAEHGRLLLSKRLAAQIRLRPGSVDYHLFSHHMSRVATQLMEMYGIRESSLPCLLFTDGKEFRRSLVVTLDAQDPISSLYSDCLRPLSDQFGLLSKHWSLCAELARKRSFIKYAHDVIDRTPRELAAIPAKIEEETRQFEARVLPLKTRLAELHHNVRL